MVLLGMFLVLQEDMLITFKDSIIPELQHVRSAALDKWTALAAWVREEADNKLKVWLDAELVGPAPGWLRLASFVAYLHCFLRAMWLFPSLSAHTIAKGALAPLSVSPLAMTDVLLLGLVYSVGTLLAVAPGLGTLCTWRRAKYLQYHLPWVAFLLAAALSHNALWLCTAYSRSLWLQCLLCGNEACVLLVGHVTPAPVGHEASMVSTVVTRLFTLLITLVAVPLESLDAWHVALGKHTPTLYHRVHALCCVPIVYFQLVRSRRCVREAAAVLR